MDNLHCLHYLDASLACNTWMDNIHCLAYLDGQHSLPALPGWTTFTACITFRCLDHLDGQPSLPALLDDCRDYLDGGP
eukprot:12409002-Karenia_brevis.AAC.1